MSGKRGPGWCWHRWSKWSEVKEEGIRVQNLGEGFAHYQRRDCEKCGRVDLREVDYR